MFPKYACQHGFLEDGIEILECSICQERFIDENVPNDDEIVKIKQCGHSFHKSCLIEWIDSAENNTCPMCRSRLFNNGLAHAQASEAAEAITKSLNEVAKQLEQYGFGDMPEIGAKLPKDLKRMVEHLSDVCNGHDDEDRADGSECSDDEFGHIAMTTMATPPYPPVSARREPQPRQRSHTASGVGRSRHANNDTSSGRNNPGSSARQGRRRGRRFVA